MNSKRPAPVTPIRQDKELAAELAWRADVLTELRAMRNLLARQRASEPNEAAAQLVASIYAAVGDRVFVSKELVAHAELPQARDLREAIVTAVNSLNARRLGKLLKRIEGHQLGQYCVSRTSEERDGAIWQVRAGLRE